MFKGQLLLFIALFFNVSLYSEDNKKEESSTQLQTLLNSFIKSPAVPAIISGVTAYFLAPRLRWFFITDPLESRKIRRIESRGYLSYLNPLFLIAYGSFHYNIQTINQRINRTPLSNNLLLAELTHGLVGAGYAWAATTYLLPKFIPISNDRFTKKLCVVTALAGALISVIKEGFTQAQPLT